MQSVACNKFSRDYTVTCSHVTYYYQVFASKILECAFLWIKYRILSVAGSNLYLHDVVSPVSIGLKIHSTERFWECILVLHITFITLVMITKPRDTWKESWKKSLCIIELILYLKIVFWSDRWINIVIMNKYQLRIK